MVLFWSHLKMMKAWIRMKHTVFGKRSRRKRMNKDSLK